jgi:hypothetical protein
VGARKLQAARGVKYRNPDQGRAQQTPGTAQDIRELAAQNHGEKALPRKSPQAHPHSDLDQPAAPGPGEEETLAHQWTRLLPSLLPEEALSPHIQGQRQPLLHATAALQFLPEPQPGRNCQPEQVNSEFPGEEDLQGAGFKAGTPRHPHIHPAFFVITPGIYFS